MKAERTLRKITAVIALAAVLISLQTLLYFCCAETEKEGNEMENIAITLERPNNRCVCKWDKPAAEGEDEYTVILEAVDEKGNAEEVFRTQVYYHLFDADNYAAYACQENGFPYMMRIRVEYYSGGELAAEGTSEQFDPRDLFPEKETLQFGTDIPLDSIKYISWDSAGMSIEANWHLGVSHYGDEYMFYSSRAGKNDIEKKIKKADWDKVVAIVAEGWMERDYISDPELVIMDGGGEGVAVSWQDEEHENLQTFYSYAADAETEEALQKWLASKEKGIFRNLKFWSFLVPVFAGGAGAIAYFLKHRA